MASNKTSGSNSVGRLPVILISLLIVLGYIMAAAVANLVWGVIVAALVIALMVLSQSSHVQNRFPRLLGQPGIQPGEPQPATNEAIHIALSAFLVMISIVEIRALNGFFIVDPYTDWDFSRVLDFLYPTNSPLNFVMYPKLHIRMFLVQGTILFILSGLILTLYTKLWRRAADLPRIGEKIKSAHLVLIIILYFAAALRPPFSIWLDHWSSWIGPAVQIREGLWPIFHSFNTYGVLSPAILLVLLKVFQPTPLFLYLVIAVTLIISLVTIFILTRHLTGDLWLAVGMVFLLGVVFHNMSMALQWPNSGAFRYGFLIGTHLLLAWFALGDNERTARWACVGLGILAYWDPITAAFPLIALVGALVYKAWHARSREVLIRVGALIGSGLLVILVIPIIAGNFHFGTLPEIYERTVGGATFFSTVGFGGTEQEFEVGILLNLAVMALGLAQLVYRIAQGTRLEREDLFVGVNLVFLIPILLYYTGRTTWIGTNAMMWIMLPGSLLIIFQLTRSYLSVQQQTFAGAAWLILIALVSSAGTATLQRIDDIWLTYEPDRYEWGRYCAEAVADGVLCPAGNWPGGIGIEAPALLSPVIPGAERVLVDACQEGMPIWSRQDAIIYEYGDCEPQISSGSVIYHFDRDYISMLLDEFVASAPFLVSATGETQNYLDVLQLYYEDQFSERGLCPQYISIEVTEWSRDCSLSYETAPSLVFVNTVLRAQFEQGASDRILYYDSSVSDSFLEQGILFYGLTQREYYSYAEGTPISDLLGSYLLTQAGSESEALNSHPEIRLDLVVAENDLYLMEITGIRDEAVLPFVYSSLMPQPGSIMPDMAGAAAQLPAGSSVLVYPDRYAPLLAGHLADGIDVYTFQGNEWPISREQAHEYLSEVTSSDPASYYVLVINQFESDPANFLVREALSRSHFGGHQFFGPVILTRLVSPGTLQVTDVNAGFGEGLTLVSVEVPDPVGGAELPVTVNWQRDEGSVIAPNLTMFVHLTDAAGQLVAQYDGTPLAGLVPFSEFDGQSITPDRFVMMLPGGLTPGTYDLRIGLYDPATGVRVFAVTEDGSITDYLVAASISMAD